jgi:enterochelin esterase-like enzyme
MTCLTSTQRLAVLAIVILLPGCDGFGQKSPPIPTLAATVISEQTLAPALRSTATPARTTTPPTTRSLVVEASGTSASTRSSTREPSAAPALTATPWPRLSGKITRVDTKFRSVILGEDQRILIYLPPGYSNQTQRRYPVLYMLHGYGGFTLQNTTEWEQWGLKDTAEKLMNDGLCQPLIIVQPFGYMADGQPTYFFNHGPGTDGKRWGDYVWQDVVRYVDINYRTISRRESRAIGGFSLGGQGALTQSLTHPEVFKIVGAHSPSFRGADGSIPVLNDEQWYNQFDPIWLVKNTDMARQLNIWLDVGLDDDKVKNCGAGSDRCVEAFHELLISKDIPHEWHDHWPGGHSNAYWTSNIPDYLEFYSANLVGQ